MKGVRSVSRFTLSACRCPLRQQRSLKRLFCCLACAPLSDISRLSLWVFSGPCSAPLPPRPFFSRGALSWLLFLQHCPSLSTLCRSLWFLLLVKTLCNQFIDVHKITHSDFYWNRINYRSSSADLTSWRAEPSCPQTWSASPLLSSSLISFISFVVFLM